MIVRILLVSTLLVAGSWGLFQLQLAGGASLEEARTAALNLFVMVKVFYLFSCRSLTHSAWRVGLFSNHWIIVGVTAQLLCQLAITYVPVMNSVFGTAPLSVGVWLQILAIAVLTVPVVAVAKRLQRED
ncbi:cation transporting ATPase C-terminal domain-containing protein [Lipingzhangella sp. LS1_29]|uniref:Cation transporting ATPase C-terminal domain-containing protein n=1 Tax=Lipingzhangella rawalii TaxID=2055835 RepID=A0ABU2HAN2_9ACTN|nr:cation transporting ATPase C-terminal domain-containing protein [Lipingzhangella rawalii]MDS1272326.1 cation transporting ATPase C-terminal domain-containing protein [Lipingzhangella rawalii]